MVRIVLADAAAVGGGREVEADARAAVVSTLAAEDSWHWQAGHPLASIMATATALALQRQALVVGHWAVACMASARHRWDELHFFFSCLLPGERLA